MVNDEFKCIFIEVPKTASTSVRRILGEPEIPHLDILQIKEKTPETVFNSYYKFGFVRNPWDRTVSLYQRKNVHKQETFEDFVTWIQNSSDTCQYPRAHKNQLDWFTDAKGNVIVDYIGKFETLHEDWTKIKVNLNCEQDLPHVNIKPHSHFSSYYTPETVEIIREKFKVDIEYFGYEYPAEPGSGDTLKHFYRTWKGKILKK
ncbi:MAG: sulfotransferase family 2 domain-containing protein [Leptospirales bacterium]